MDISSVNLDCSLVLMLLSYVLSWVLEFLLSK